MLLATCDVEGTNLCTGETMMFSFTASGGAVCEEICFNVTIYDDSGTSKPLGGT